MCVNADVEALPISLNILADLAEVCLFLYPSCEVVFIVLTIVIDC